MNISKTFEVRAPKIATYPTAIPCINPDLVIGLELETEQCGKASAARYQEWAAPCNFTVETDGSLRGLAYEFISKPMRSNTALAALTAFFATTGFTEDNYSDRCSVHVHVNCTDMELEQVGNVALLYATLEEILFEFVGGNRDTNIFCIPWNQCRAHHKLVDHFINQPGDTLALWNKYTALNLIPLKVQGTVEFRQMHGTCDMEKITKWINIIGAIFLYAKKVELKDLIETIKSLNTTSHYATFFYEVLQGTLPYNDLYQQKLEEGVILAKYSLMGFGGKKEKTAPARPLKTQTRDRGIGDMIQAAELYNRVAMQMNDVLQHEAQIPALHPEQRWDMPVNPVPQEVNLDLVMDEVEHEIDDGRDEEMEF